MTFLEDMAEWVSGLSYRDIPERVLDLARHQIASVLAALYAGAGSTGGCTVIEAVRAWEEGGSCTAMPAGEPQPLYSALLQNCSLSMALDYDDYLFLGHTGHSAVLVPLAVAEMRGADAETMLVAQVAANEVAGRLGGSVVLGPHNGQMWAYIHLLGAAAGASRVLGLDPDRTADAMGIALYEPVYPLMPGFMGAQSKVLTAATPAVTGATAAFLAEAGMTGSRAIMEDPQGFLANMSFLPLPFMLTGLGRSWVTDTIAFKPYPGCAYIDTAVDAVLEIMRCFLEENGRRLDPEEIDKVVVDASILTTAMDAMSGGYLEKSRLSPSNINFSIPQSLAIAVLAGELTGAQLTEDYLEENKRGILDLASRVCLAHDAGFTVGFLRALDDVVDLKSLIAQVGLDEYLGARRKLREHLRSVATLDLRLALQAWKSLTAEERAFLRSLVSLRSILGKASPYDLGEARLELATMPFGARVHVRLRDGSSLEAERSIPRGGPGDGCRLDVPKEKFKREVARFIDAEKASEALEAILDIENRGLSDLKEVLFRGRTRGV